MTERRLFCPDAKTLADAMRDGAVPLDTEEAHYARAVLRLPSSSLVVALDGSGRAATATLQHVGKRDAELHFASDATASLQPWGRDVHLVMPVAKGDRTDWLLEKVTEMGVSSVTFARFARSVAHADGHNRWLRFARVTKAAARQARHGRLPLLSGCASLEEAVTSQAAKNATRLVAHPTQDAQPLPLAVAKTRAVVIVIGPEGGLSQDELQGLVAHDYTTVTLGPHVLRMETAAMVALAACVSMPLP